MSVYTDVLAKAKAHQRRNGTRATAATPPPPVNRLGPETELEPSDDLPLEGIADWPAPLSAVAMPGLVGDMLGVIGPQTEADPAALLLHLLVFFGSCAGRAAYFAVGGTWHHANLFGLCVGPTSEGRKGTARDAIARPFQDVDPEWLTRRMMGGLASGEGLVWAVRDASKDGKDEGVTDKRLCVFEAEYAAPLRLMAKDGNVLGSTLRQGWDRGELANLSKNSPATATGAHLSLVGHISVEELRELLRTVDMANGFLNRHLLVMVRRSQLLPEGGRLDSRTLSTVVQGLRDAVDHARKMGEMQRDAQAREQWAALYAGLSTRGPGLLGAVLGRAEAQVARLSLVYALLDCAQEIGRRHLEAALELWRYAADSARFIFGDLVGDPLADKILTLIRDAAAGLTRTQLYDALNRNIAREKITEALRKLARYGQIHREVIPTSGRPIERWYPVRRRGFSPLIALGVGGGSLKREREPGEEPGQ